MNRFLSLLTAMLLAATLHGQIFDQILPLDQILNNDKAYIVLTSGDTISGRLTGYRSGGKEKRALIQEGNDGIYQLTIKMGKDDKVEVGLDSVARLAIVPTLGMARFKQTNLGGDLIELNRLRKDPYIKELSKGEPLFKLEPPNDEDKWVIFEAIKVGYYLMKGSSEPDFELRQLLNPTFDSRIKVYPEVPEEEVENVDETTINGLNISSNVPGSYLISIDGGEIMRIQQLGHRNKAKSKIFRDCAIISDKPNWKDLALDVFKDHMECGTGKL